MKIASFVNLKIESVLAIKTKNKILINLDYHIYKKGRIEKYRFIFAKLKSNANEKEKKLCFKSSKKLMQRKKVARSSISRKMF